MNPKKIECSIVVCSMVFSSLLILIQLETPPVMGDLYHANPPYGVGASTSAEDAIGPPYDRDGIPLNNHVLWSAIDNPHIIRDTYWVESGYMLTIEEGCEIRFDPGTSLWVQGSFSAIGMATQIKFTSNLTIKNPGDWERILVDGGSIDMFNCDVEYATDAIYLENMAFLANLAESDIHHNSNYGVYLEFIMGGPPIIGNDIYNCTHGVCSLSSSTQMMNNDIFNNTNGVYLGIQPGNGPFIPFLNNNNIIHNKIDGIIAEGDSPGLMNNRISHNGRHGINATPDPTTGFEPSIMASDNDITNNSGNGIYLYNCSNFATSLIELNYISNNSKEGIYILSDSGPSGNVEISNNDILSNSKGIYVKGENPSIHDNYIAFNKEYGIYACDDSLYGPTSPQIINNTLENNTDIGVWIDGIQPTIQGGNILNSTYGIYIENNADPWIDGVWIENSTKSGWGIELHNSRANITNTTITNFRFGIRSFSSDLNIYRSNLEDWGLVGILSLSVSKVLVENTTMSSPGPQHFNIAQGSNVTALNTTFDKNKVFINLITSKFTVQWWVHIKVNESDGEPAVGAQTWLNDTFENIVLNETTDSHGWIKWVKVTEYCQNVTDKLMFNTHIATALNDSERGITYTDIESYQIIYIDLDLIRNYPIPLFKGWNMISIPVNLTETDLTDVFKGSKYKAVRRYNASDYSDNWKQYVVDKVSTPFEDENDLIYINNTMGLWVLIEQNDELKVTGRFPNPMNIQLKKGWNFVGYPSLSTRAIGDANLPGECNLIMYYNASIGQWEDNDPVSSFNPIGYIRPRDGYWLHITNDAFWMVS